MTDANITCDFCNDRCQIAAARLGKDIFVGTDFRDMAAIVL